MRLLYTFLLWLSRRELVIANSTGRNPDNIKKIKGDIDRWEDALDRVNLPPLYD